LGSLPQRKEDKNLRKWRKMPSAKGPQLSELTVETVTPRAEVMTGWRGADWKDVKDRRILQLAAQILSSRLLDEIREKQGLTYSIYCRANPGRAYPGTGLFFARFNADPEKVVDAENLTEAVMLRFTSEGPTEQELDTVRKQMRNELETLLKTPGYWVGVLADLEYQQTKLSDVKEVLPKILSYTQKDVTNVLKKYIRPEARMRVIAKPQTPASVEPEAAAIGR
jgi:zinc protease